MNTSDRAGYANDVADVGEQLTNVRKNIDNSQAPFVCGALRAAEAAVQLAYDTLQDPNVRSEDL